MNNFEIDDGDAFDRLLVGSTIDSRLPKTTEIPIDLPKSRQDELSSDEDIVRTTHFKKTVFDDSSDDDLPLTFKKGILDSLDDDKISANDISDEEVGSRRKSAKRIKQLLDDSDDDDLPSVKATFMSPSRNPAANTHQSPSTIVNKPDDEHSDSDASIKSNLSSRSRKSEGSESGSPQSSGGEESNDETSIEAIKSKIMNKHKTTKTKLLSEPGSMDPEKKVKSKLSKEKAPSRKAKEAALAEIHSETQRMIRERQISLPYHKPKQRSLAEFLNRRKFAPTVRLKTTSDELAKVWQHAEEREKTAELFYKSDSDEESDKKDTSRVECVDVTTSQDAASNLKENLDETTTPLTAKPRIDSQSLISSSQPPDSEEFPRLQLSEILADTFDSGNANSLKVDDVIDEINDPKENGPNAKEIHSLGNAIPDTKEVTAVDAVGIIASSDSEPLVNSENVCHSSSTLDESNSFSCLSEKINSLNIPIAKCPKISGAPDEVIDLDELATKPGAFGLMQRFLKHAKLKPKVKQQSTVSVISSEVNDCGEIINLTEETIKVKNKDEKKPGERLTVLKTTLQQKIAENRGQQLAKRFEEYKLYEEEFYGVEKTLEDDEEEEEVISEDECGRKGEKEEVDEDRDIDNPFLDAEADESDVEEQPLDSVDDENDDDKNEEHDSEKSDAEESASDLLGGSSDEEPEIEEDSKPLYDNEDDENMVPTPPIPSAFHSLAGTQTADPVDESQLMAMCSGNFSSSTLDLKKLETSSEAFQNPPDEVDELELSQQCDDNDSDNEEILAKKPAKYKRNRKLSFSDDEEDTKGDPVTLSDTEGNGKIDSALNDNAEEGNSDLEHDLEDDGELSEEELAVEEDEDDEEVQLAKKLTKGFLDKEAELSESEWGSEDEDEKGLDHYEEEEGDKEQISQRRLQKELGKIHMREVLADDNREIRILQELLLEDGDLHSDGPKRQRLFRWYNQDDDNPGEKRSLDFGDNANDNNEEDDEESWRRQRLERENYIRKKKIDNMELEIVDTPVNFSDTRRGVKVNPKIIPAANKSPDPKSQFSIFSKRGSFLGRGEKMLSKLAEITNSAGSKENAMGNTRNNRNMVFSIVSPPKEKEAEEIKPEMPLKRKGNFIATSIVKKIKFNSNNTTTKVSALEQLKLFEST